jgi:acetyl esterase/lipase
MVAWLLLLVSLVGAALVYNVYRPMAPTSRRAPPSFFLGWLEAELAIHHIGWQALFTVGFVAAGALSSWPGWLGLGVALVSWVALGLHYARGYRARETVEAALREAFGWDYEERILPDLRAQLPRHVRWGPILAPFPIRHPGVERIRSIRYGRASAVDLKLDVYRLRNLERRGPTLMYVHGGGWVIGTKNTQGLPLAYRLASQGWICFNVNYRLSPHATFPDHLIDLKRAVAWIRKHGGELGADSDFIVVAGGSAGGHLAALLALTPGDPEYQPGFEEADTAVQGCIPYYGIYDFTNRADLWSRAVLRVLLERHVMKATFEENPEVFERASPIRRITPAAPPFLVVHGADDSLVPAHQARDFCAAFRRRAAAPIAYAEIPGAQHAFELFPSLRSQLVTHGVERFLAYLYSQYRRGELRQPPAQGDAAARVSAGS